MRAFVSIIATVIWLASGSTGAKSFEQFEDIVRHENDYSCRQLTEIADELDCDDRAQSSRSP